LVSATRIARCQTRVARSHAATVDVIILFASVIRFVERRVAFVSRTNKSKTEIAAPSVPGRAQRLALFGPPLLIEGEDAAANDQLLARICAAASGFGRIPENICS
jgi:transcriptional regulator of aromatic amino acid metabolism